MNSPDERALYDALHTEVLSTEALQRIRSSVAHEWQAQFSRSRRRYWGLAIAAMAATAVPAAMPVGGAWHAHTPGRGATGLTDSKRWSTAGA
jgi:hypothetical protein